ncbi:MAG: DNA topoisomerase 3 [Oscillospiraceae bacterium]|nr:DNA topoisomerase 3 [Oscillospiraceae bacterium]
MRLVIAEKPSVAQSIAKVIGADKRNEGYLEGNGYYVSWCIGHLVELCTPDVYDEKYTKWAKEDLPILPDPFKLIVSKDKTKQFGILKALMSRKDVEEIICATDAGREGELIFRLVYQQAKCNKPFKRLWISSMEDSAIKDGFSHMKDGHEYDALYEAAFCRSKADWLVGINATRLFTCTYGKKLTVGRVQTPTLALIVERQDQIDHFKKEKYFNIHLKKDALEVIKERITDESSAKAIKEKCDGKELIITTVKKSKKNINPPKLYDLTTLQREANKFFGYTAQKTLDITQRLYEKKLVTYPRTDSQYLTEDMKGAAEQLLETICRVFHHSVGSGVEISRIIDGNKVSDHHAIIPTAEIEKQDLTILSKEETDILKLIAFNMLCAVGTAHEYLETEISAVCEGETLKAKGRTVTAPGWKATEAATKSTLRKKSDKADKDLTIPELTEGQCISPVKASMSEHYTQPPKPFNEDSLLSKMETAGNEAFDAETEKKGLGTPATRAAIIEKLISSGYVIRKGRKLLPTEDGIRLIKLIPDVIKSPKLTADWENTLLQMERGKSEPELFLEEIRRLVCDLVTEYNIVSAEDEKLFSSARSAIGKCPRCGNPVYEGKRSYYCSDRNCGFCIWKESKSLSAMKKKVDFHMAKELLETGRTHVKGLLSPKKWTRFDADLVLEDTGERVNLKLDFQKEGRKQ